MKKITKVFKPVVIPRATVMLNQHAPVHVDKKKQTSKKACRKGVVY